MIGKPILRVEDGRFITGRGRYVDDIDMPGALHLVVVRSAHAHARITGIDGKAALDDPEVRAVFCAHDLPELDGAIRLRRGTLGVPVKPSAQSGLAGNLVRFAGEPVAAVVATTAYAAADGAERVVVEYEPLPPLTNVPQALAPEAPAVHGGWGDNVAGSLRLEMGDLDRARNESAVIVSRRFVFPRLSAVPMEPRAVAARWDATTSTLEMWATTQLPWHVRECIAEVLGLPLSRVRVVAPDVGGGFGSKGTMYAEYLLAATLARRLSRPVKWVETRTESFTSTVHGGDQQHEATLGARADGTFTFLDDDFAVDAGAYLPNGGVAPNNTATHLMGLYRLDAFRCRLRICMTHKTPTRPYRGAGRAEAVFAVERLIDALARELRADPADIRRRNLIRPDELPLNRGISYRDGASVVYDSGDYPKLFDLALERADYAGWRARQRRGREEGRVLGIGVATYADGTGIGPQEEATVAVDENGKVSVGVGPPSQGQSHETTMAQICAERLGVSIESVSFDTDGTHDFASTSGTYGSRIAVVLGSAVALASDAVREKAAQLAAAQLECDPRDIVIADGRAHVRGAPTRAIALSQLSRLARTSEGAALLGEPRLSATRSFAPPSVTWAAGVHVAAVEVDPDTGAVSVLSYTAAHDAGREINPQVVAGQVHGGVVQGLGAALAEHIVYDNAGQLLTGTLLEYGVPRAPDVPSIAIERHDSPSPRNPLGVKGAGEGSAIPPAAVIANAVSDALSQYGAEINEVPVTAERIARLMGKVTGHDGSAR